MSAEQGMLHAMRQLQAQQVCDRPCWYGQQRHWACNFHQLICRVQLPGTAQACVVCIGNTKNQAMQISYPAAGSEGRWEKLSCAAHLQEQLSALCLTARERHL